MSQYVTAVANHVTLIAFSEVTFGMNLRRHISCFVINLSQFYIELVTTFTSHCTNKQLCLRIPISIIYRQYCIVISVTYNTDSQYTHMYVVLSLHVID